MFDRFMVALFATVRANTQAIKQKTRATLIMPCASTL
jgi:hypothetical protein